MTILPMRLAQSAADYDELGIQRGAFSAREDRMHVDGRPGTYEWWFMKADVAECIAIIGIGTSPYFRAELGLAPQANAVIIFPDGKVINENVYLEPDDLESLADDDCDVRAGNSFFRGDGLRSYRAHFEIDDLHVDIELSPTAPPWRPEAGQLLFGGSDENYFGWSIPVPKGDARVVVRGRGLDVDSRGTGYIDRGWMDKPLGEFLNNWVWYYWDFNDYTVAAIYMTFAEEYGYPEFPFFMVYRNGERLAGGSGTQNADHITFTPGKTHVDSSTGKPVIDDFVYEYQDGPRRFTLSVENKIATEHVNFADMLTGTEEEKRQASVYGGAEVRFTGPAVFTHYEGDQVIETVRVESGPFCEFFYMGRPR